MTRAVHQWLDEFALCVRTCDYARADRMFDPWAVGFGTQVSKAPTLGHLIEDQWQKTWPHTSEFKFLSDIQTKETWYQTVVMARWQSVNNLKHTIRMGRATLVLQRHWRKYRCVHSHFSIDPTPEFL